MLKGRTMVLHLYCQFMSPLLLRIILMNTIQLLVIIVYVELVKHNILLSYIFAELLLYIF